MFVKIATAAIIFIAISISQQKPTPQRVGADQGKGGRTPDAKSAKWNVKAYQADFDFANRYSGQLYEQGTARGIIAWRGQVVRTEQGKTPRLLSTAGDSDTLKSYIKPG